jgi:hypothetical protein
MNTATGTKGLMTHKEMTAHIRSRLKAAGIPAKCSMQVTCGSLHIYVRPVSYVARWTAEQTAAIFRLAHANRLTLVRGMEIDERHMSGEIPSIDTWFEFHPDRAPVKEGIACASCGERIEHVPSAHMDRRPRQGDFCDVCRKAGAMWDEYKAEVSR